VKPESKFWKQIKENLPNIHWTRFENWATPGVPDAHGCKDGISFWIELKVIRSNKINLSPHQIMWNYKYSLHGGRSFIMALALSRSLLYIFPGSVVLSIGSIAHCPSPNWQVSMSPGAGVASSWKQVEEVLLHCPLPRPSPNKTVT
tara:strand:+ start:508 stop:945 length:438 start_codon:yes stop_codon:yes gene_type:complete